MYMLKTHFLALLAVSVGLSSHFVRPFTRGAVLTDASIIVHKEGQVVLSSLGGNYNEGLPCFQQWPWAVNLGVSFFGKF